ncbi:hypothetical protein BCR44DRAFT_1525306 [Catenaria anguillulae PL171]|uniref:F-box domain-containing protein n=1 Tax=Catenaria anguillulae PL171 TaxID=765915 RepID=A0A1Y2HQJ1_9FUNG|nr:hypothetical protein BCR44DRAFT_1525306 [Catenaria anguillulae PL171]
MCECRLDRKSSAPWLKPSRPHCWCYGCQTRLSSPSIAFFLLSHPVRGCTHVFTPAAYPKLKLAGDKEPSTSRCDTVDHDSVACARSHITTTASFGSPINIDFGFGGFRRSRDKKSKYSTRGNRTASRSRAPDSELSDSGSESVSSSPPLPSTRGPAAQDHAITARLAATQRILHSLFSLKFDPSTTTAMSSSSSPLPSTGMSLADLPAEILVSIGSLLPPKALVSTRTACKSLYTNLAPVALRNPTVYSTSHLHYTLRLLQDLDCTQALHSITLSDTYLAQASLAHVPLDDPFATRGRPEWAAIDWSRFTSLHTVTVEGVSASRPLRHLASHVLASGPPNVSKITLRFLDLGSLRKLDGFLALAVPCKRLNDVTLNVLGALTHSPSVAGSAATSDAEMDDLPGGDNSDNDEHDTGFDSGYDATSLGSPTLASFPTPLSAAASGTAAATRHSATLVLSRLSTLRLRHCDLSPTALTHILRRCTSLRHLDVHRSLHHEPNDDVRVAARAIVHGIQHLSIKVNPDQLVGVLADLGRLSASLTHVTLAWDADDAVQGDALLALRAAVAGACPRVCRVDLVEEVADASLVKTNAQCMMLKCQGLRRRQSWIRMPVNLSMSAATAGSASAAVTKEALGVRKRRCVPPMAELERLHAGLRRAIEEAVSDEEADVNDAGSDSGHSSADDDSGAGGMFDFGDWAEIAEDLVF